MTAVVYIRHKATHSDTPITALLYTPTTPRSTLVYSCQKPSLSRPAFFRHRVKPAKMISSTTGRPLISMKHMAFPVVASLYSNLTIPSLVLRRRFHFPRSSPAWPPPHVHDRLPTKGQSFFVVPSSSMVAPCTRD